MTEQTKFDTVLIANRGEIAVRVIASAKRLGLRTVAVFSEADRGALHVREADEAVFLGPVPASESYLRPDAVIEAALATGAGAIHPGYGFLSENAEFARACQAAGIEFIGPTPEQLEIFGAKHTARAAAEAAGVPLLPGTGLLADEDEAAAEASRIGYPVMLKATAGGGGIGMQACADEAELRSAWHNVRRLAGASFSSAGVFLERLVTRARHVEVQVFGDGEGRVVDLGDRDCSLQRRNQKVLEESPAPGLPDGVRDQMLSSARDLCASVDYRSAGTVEFIYDPDRQEVSFLEVNTRLQVEHPITEARYGVDLVAWMLRLAQGETGVLNELTTPSGAAVEARIYAENTDLGDLPSSGEISSFTAPAGARVDTWIETGAVVSNHYDPMLAKIISYGADRAEAWANLANALGDTRVQGVATNLGLLRSAVTNETVAAAEHTTSTLATVMNTEPRLQVVRPGLLTTIQAWPGRVGYWSVGIPPSGPMDDLSFRLGNQALGNDVAAAGLEMTMAGPTLLFHTTTRVIVTGAPTPVTVAGSPVPQWEPIEIPAGAELSIGTPTSGMRTYLLVEGGLDVAPVLGSAATFDLGEMGGLAGRALTSGDIVPIATPASPQEVAAVPEPARPQIETQWQIAALEGHHAAPEFFTEADMETFYETDWQVHFNSARTGVRLSGPKPEWARTDGGEAGLHPSNIHDTAYMVGAVDYTGDMPILLGPDGPSLGGFTCPATVASGQKWKLGQLRPSDTVRFIPISDEQAAEVRANPLALPEAGRTAVSDGGVLFHEPEHDGLPSLTVRRSGDRALLVELGPMLLDLAVRMRIHALAASLVDPELPAIPGLGELTPGIRSVQVQFDPDLISAAELAEIIHDRELGLPATHDLRVPSRVVHLPLSWDDPATREAIERYMNGVRSDAPWCPWNIEFIRRINGLESVEDVYATVFDAEYLVLGLGDVYLGAPVATPLDPRHRLVTTKYNPARTWTPQNAVGIGGAYLCIYGMEGPGGYQFVGRTTQVWSTLRQGGSFEPGVPWLLRFFDRIKWYPVSTEELAQMRADQAAGRLQLRIEEGEFSVADHEAFLEANADSIAEFRAQQSAAFGAERDAWTAAGEFERAAAAGANEVPDAGEIPAGCETITAQFAANVFRVDVAVGDVIEAGQVVMAVEAMKMEAPVVATVGGVVEAISAPPGSEVAPGSVLLIVRTEEEVELAS